MTTLENLDIVRTQKGPLIGIVIPEANRKRVIVSKPVTKSLKEYNDNYFSSNKVFYRSIKVIHSIIIKE